MKKAASVSGGANRILHDYEKEGDLPMIRMRKPRKWDICIEEQLGKENTP